MWVLILPLVLGDVLVHGSISEALAGVLHYLHALGVEVWLEAEALDVSIFVLFLQLVPMVLILLMVVEHDLRPRQILHGRRLV